MCCFTVFAKMISAILLTVSSSADRGAAGFPLPLAPQVVRFTCFSDSVRYTNGHIRF